MPITIWSETKGRRFVSAKGTVVFNSRSKRYDLCWQKKGKFFVIDLDAALTDRERLEDEKEKARKAFFDESFDEIIEEARASGRYNALFALSHSRRRRR